MHVVCYYHLHRIGVAWVHHNAYGSNRLSFTFIGLLDSVLAQARY